MSKRRKLHEISIENDIRYRGPLSFQSLQILGWLCIALVAVEMMFRLSFMVNPALAEKDEIILMVINFISALSLPFLLTANFAQILNNSEGYKRQLLRNGGAAVAILLASFFFFRRYIAGNIAMFASDPEEVVPVLTELFCSLHKHGFLAFNLFIDLFLCTLFMFFLNATPSRFFTGKKIILFRLAALLPVACEVISLNFKGLAARGEIMLPLWSFPLMTVKPPMTFVVFMILALHIKMREFRFCRHGRTHEEYQAYLKTNRNSLNFSVFAAVVFVIAAIVDFLILVFMIAAAPGTSEMTEVTEELLEVAEIPMAMGFGESMGLLFAAPFMLLFSYTRIPRNKKISMLIPVAAFVLMAFIFIEGIHQVLAQLSLTTDPLSVRELMDSFFGLGEAPF